MGQVATITLTKAPPSLNNAYANVAGRGRVPKKELVAWRKIAGWELNTQHVPTIPGKVIIEIEVARSKRRSDISNRIKACEDLLVDHGVIEDDSLVQRITASWSDDIEGCRVSVRPA